MSLFSAKSLLLNYHYWTVLYILSLTSNAAATITTPNLLCFNDSWNIIKGQWEFDPDTCSLQNTVSAQENMVWFGSLDGTVPDYRYDFDTFTITAVIEFEPEDGDAGIMFRTAQSLPIDDIDVGPSYYLGVYLANYVVFGELNNGWSGPLAQSGVTINAQIPYTLTVTASNSIYNVYVDDVIVISTLNQAALTQGSFGIRTVNVPTTFHSLIYEAHIQLESCNTNNYYIRYTDGHLEMNADDLSPEFSENSTFILRIPGLANDIDYITLRPMNVEEYFLRHQNKELYIHPYDDTALFKNDSSFKIVLALNGDPDCISLQSFNFPTYFIRDGHPLMTIDTFVDDTTYKNDASFRIPNFNLPTSAISPTTHTTLQPTLYPTGIIHEDLDPAVLDGIVFDEVTTETFGGSTSYDIGWVKVMYCAESDDAIFNYIGGVDTTDTSRFLELAPYAITVKIVPDESDGLTQTEFDDLAVYAKVCQNSIIALNNALEISYEIDPNTLEFTGYQQVSKNWYGATSTATDRLLNGCVSNGVETITAGFYQACNNQAGLHMQRRVCEFETYNPRTGKTISVWFGFDATRSDVCTDAGNGALLAIDLKSTHKPTIPPTTNPTLQPTSTPTIDPGISPTTHPTLQPTSTPTIDPTIPPTTNPTLQPTSTPTIDPTIPPTTHPTLQPTLYPTEILTKGTRDDETTDDDYDNGENTDKQTNMDNAANDFWITVHNHIFGIFLIFLVVIGCLGMSLVYIVYTIYKKQNNALIEMVSMQNEVPVVTELEVPRRKLNPTDSIDPSSLPDLPE